MRAHAAHVGTGAPHERGGGPRVVGGVRGDALLGERGEALGGAGVLQLGLDLGDVDFRGVFGGRLAGGRGGRGARSGSSSGASSSSGAARAWTEVEDGVEVEYLTEAEIKARLAGIAAARAQLVAQRDTVSDERRNGLAMAANGAVATLLTVRRPFGILGMIAAVAGTATVWGIIQFLGAQRNLNTLNEHLAKLTEERKEYEALLEE